MLSVSLSYPGFRPGGSPLRKQNFPNPGPWEVPPARAEGYISPMERVLSSGKRTPKRPRSEALVKYHTPSPFRPCSSVLVRVRPSRALIEPPKEPVSQDPRGHIPLNPKSTIPNPQSPPPHGRSEGPFFSSPEEVHSLPSARNPYRAPQAVLPPGRVGPTRPPGGASSSNSSSFRWMSGRSVNAA